MHIHKVILILKYVYIYTYVCVYINIIHRRQWTLRVLEETCVYVCEIRHTCTHTHTYTYLYSHMNKHKSTGGHGLSGQPKGVYKIFIDAVIHPHAHSHTQICTRTQIYIHMYISIHISMYRRQWALRAARRNEGPNVSNQKLLNMRDGVIPALLQVRGRMCIYGLVCIRIYMCLCLFVCVCMYVDTYTSNTFRYVCKYSYNYILI